MVHAEGALCLLVSLYHIIVNNLTLNKLILSNIIVPLNQLEEPGFCFFVYL